MGVNGRKIGQKQEAAQGLTSHSIPGEPGWVHSMSLTNRERQNNISAQVAGRRTCSSGAFASQPLYLQPKWREAAGFYRTPLLGLSLTCLSGVAPWSMPHPFPGCKGTPCILEELVTVSASSDHFPSATAQWSMWLPDLNMMQIPKSTCLPINYN